MNLNEWKCKNCAKRATPHDRVNEKSMRTSTNAHSRPNIARNREEKGNSAYKEKGQDSCREKDQGRITKYIEMQAERESAQRILLDFVLKSVLEIMLPRQESEQHIPSRSSITKQGTKSSFCKYISYTHVLDAARRLETALLSFPTYVSSLCSPVPSHSFLEDCQRRSLFIGLFFSCLLRNIWLRSSCWDEM
jgi:hypothetical protein